MKTHTTTRMGAALALACAVLTAACSDDFGLTEPVSAPAQSYHEAGRWAWDATSSDATSSGTTSSDSDSLADSSADSSDDDWRLVDSDLYWPTRQASATIGRKGGTVTLWAVGDNHWQPYHTITVPPGAVSRPTYFVIELGPDSAIDVHLSAKDLSTWTPITEFRKPISLSLTYAGGSVEDPSRLAIVYMEDGMISEVLDTAVDPDLQIIIAELLHFSRYAVATE